MSPVRLNGATSGYAELAASATAGDVILTLPSTAGTLDRTNRAGNILQVVQAAKSDSFSTASTTFTDVTGLSASITPSSSANKVLVMAMFMGSASMYNYTTYKMVVNSSDLFVGDADGSRTRANSQMNISGYGMDYVNPTQTFLYLHSPATVSSLTYKLQVKVDAGTTKINSSQAYNNATAITGSSSIVLLEVAA